MATLTPSPKMQFLDANGNPLAGGKLYTYASGTTTPQATYTDATGGTPNANPIILDSRGEASVWLGTSLYSFRLTTSSDSLVWTADAVGGVVTLSDLASSGGSSLVGFIQSGAGAVATTAQAKLREFVSVKDFGAVGDGVTNDTAAIQAAINTGVSILFPHGTYLASGLTQSTNGQYIYGQGKVFIKKNANGVIFTSTGNDVVLQDLNFIGDSATPTFTGDNVQLLGERPTFKFCSSYWAYGRALKATKNKVTILCAENIVQTADTTATGYDIEIGTSGTATLYHEIHGYHSAQSTGGLLLTDTGSHKVIGGEFGKYTIASGTGPAGSNGGTLVGARVTGNVSIGLPNAILTANQFGAIAITFAAGTALCTMDESNVYSSGCTITNSGNANNVIRKNTSTGSYQKIRYGDDAQTCEVQVGSTLYEFVGTNGIVIPNNTSYRSRNSSGTITSLVTLSSTDNQTFGANLGTVTSVLGGSNVYFNTAGTNRWFVNATALQPAADNTYALGGAAARPTVIYAVSGTINTSDARAKTDILPIEAAEKSVATTLKTLIKKFRFIDAVEKKGTNARIHFGVMAQEVRDAFIAGGLDPNRYAIFCYDEWPEQLATYDADGNELTGYVAAGNRYGIRYEELLCFIISAM